MNRHTYRSFGYLVGMLLVGSLDRSQRVIAAMKCRGFRGRFHVFDHFSWHRRDTLFAVVSAVVLAGLVCGEML
jgi:cobalt/nickel transport system permease protein